MDDLGRNVYAGAVLGVTLTVILFWTPAAHHRLGRGQDRLARLRVSVRLAVAGMTLLAMSLASAIIAVVRFAFDSTAVGLWFGGIPLVVVIVLWYALPIMGGRDRP